MATDLYFLMLLLVGQAVLQEAQISDSSIEQTHENSNESSRDLTIKNAVEYAIVNPQNLSLADTNSGYSIVIKNIDPQTRIDTSEKDISKDPSKKLTVKNLEDETVKSKNYSSKNHSNSADKDLSYSANKDLSNSAVVLNSELERITEAVSSDELENKWKNQNRNFFESQISDPGQIREQITKEPELFGNVNDSKSIIPADKISSAVNVSFFRNDTEASIPDDVESSNAQMLLYDRYKKRNKFTFFPSARNHARSKVTGGKGVTTLSGVFKLTSNARPELSGLNGNSDSETAVMSNLFSTKFHDATAKSSTSTSTSDETATKSSTSTSTSDEIATRPSTSASKSDGTVTRSSLLTTRLHDVISKSSTSTSDETATKSSTSTSTSDEIATRPSTSASKSDGTATRSSLLTTRLHDVISKSSTSTSTGDETATESSLFVTRLHDLTAESSTSTSTSDEAATKSSLFTPGLLLATAMSSMPTTRNSETSSASNAKSNQTITMSSVFTRSSDEKVRMSRWTSDENPTTSGISTTTTDVLNLFSKTNNNSEAATGNGALMSALVQSETIPPFRTKLGSKAMISCNTDMFCSHRCPNKRPIFTQNSDNYYERLSSKQNQDSDLLARGKYSDIYIVSTNREEVSNMYSWRHLDLINKTNRRSNDHENVSQPEYKIQGMSMNNLSFAYRDNDTSTYFSHCQSFSCACDDLCVMYGDCCPDVFDACFSLSTTETIITFINETRNRFSVDFPLINFTQALKGNRNYSTEIIDTFVFKYGTCQQTLKMNVLMITRCPENLQDNVSLRKLCEEPDSPLLPPVTAKLSERYVTFKNVFCAQCHGVYEEALDIWTSRIECMPQVRNTDGSFYSIAGLANLVDTEKCNITFSKDASMNEMRVCNLDLQNYELTAVNASICSATDAFLCGFYHFPLSGFKNPHCMSCAESAYMPQITSVNNDIACLRTTSYGGGASVITGGILIILDITGTYNRDDCYSEIMSYVCADNQVFNPYTQECKQLLCPHGQEPYRGKCIETKDAYFVEASSQIFPRKWRRLQMSVNVSENESVYCEDLYKNRQQYFTVNITMTNRVRNSSEINNELWFSTEIDTNCHEIYKNSEHNNSPRIDFSLDLTLDVSLTVLKNLEVFTSNLFFLEKYNSSQIILTNMEDSDKSNYICNKSGSLQKRTKFALTEYKNQVYALFNSTLKGVYYPLSNIGYEMAISRDANGSFEVTNAVFVCDIEGTFITKNCSAVGVPLRDTIINETGLFIIASGEYYTPKEFKINGEQVIVCTNYTSETRSKNLEQQNITYVIVSFVFTALSILFLFAMLLLYYLFPELCTLPGKMTASLAGTMLFTFLSNLFTHFDLHNDYICPLVAALSHLVTLAYFGWMSAIAVNMALTFGSSTPKSMKSPKANKMFARYNVVVWGLSAGIVTTAVIIDVLHRHTPASSDKTEVHDDINLTTASWDITGYPVYGYPFCTWFSGSMWTKVSFIFAPFCLTYATSVIGFIVTLLGIQRSSRCVETLGKRSSDRLCCWIYIKLSTAMGFSWIVSLILISFPGSEVLEYIYVSLVLAQGVLLFLAFMANRRVFNLVSKKFYCGKEEKNSITTTTKSSISVTKTA